MPTHASAIVAKFGGSSLADAAQCRNVAQIIVADPQRRFVVVSAPGKAHTTDIKMTDLLIALAAHEPGSTSWDAAWAPIAARLDHLLDDLQLRAALPTLGADVLAAMYAAPTHDFIVSRGEWLSAQIIAAFLAQLGHAATALDAAACIRFTTDGRLDYDATCAAVQHHVPPHGIVVIPGFYGADDNGTVHTFSRGGSDITGALVACALRATTYENWTDVSGFYNAHPALTPDARPIAAMTYQEARALSYAGATVLHQETVAHLVANDVVLHVRNTNDPDAPGTRISAHSHDAATHVGVAGKAGFVIFTIEKMMMNDEVGFGRRVLSVFEDCGVSYDHQVTGIDTLSLIIDRRNFHAGDAAAVIERLNTALRAAVAPDRITMQDDVAVLTLVSRGHGGTSGLVRYLQALATAHIDVISTGQEVNGQIISILTAGQLPVAIRAVHREFFP